MSGALILRWLMARSGMVAIAAIMAAGLLSAAAHSEQSKKSNRTGGDIRAKSAANSKLLTIYSSLPLQGVTRPDSADTIRAIEMALGTAGAQTGDNIYQVGPFRIRYGPGQQLDNIDPSNGVVGVNQVERNARRASADKTTIAYIGEASSSSSMASMKITNSHGILQLSPNNTYIGLTSSAYPAKKGEPWIYMPTKKRTYGRIVPTDLIQGPAMAKLMKSQGCKLLYVVNDGQYDPVRGALQPTTYGNEIALLVLKAARKLGIKIANLRPKTLDPQALNYAPVANLVKRSKADCFFFGGTSRNRASEVFTRVFSANPELKFFGADGVADFLFTTALSNKLQARTFITFPTLDPKAYPRSARRFFSQFRARYAKDPEPHAFYGYQTTLLLLDAIRRAGKNPTRDKVVKAFFNTPFHNSDLGRFRITKTGDSTLTDYGGYKIENGRLKFLRVLKG